MTTTTQTTDRILNRAPKGGMVSSVNGLFYKGGQFVPMLSTSTPVKPTPLAGSTRQVAWANRLRTQALANLNDEIHARRLFLNSKKDAKVVRPVVRKLLIARHKLMTERSAANVIASHVAH